MVLISKFLILSRDITGCLGASNIIFLNSSAFTSTLCEKLTSVFLWVTEWFSRKVTTLKGFSKVTLEHFKFNSTRNSGFQ